MRDFTLNKSAFSIHKLGEEPKAYIYWLQQSAEKRISAIEFLREQYHTKDEIQSRLQRVYRIAQLASS
jgi:hypothetical protein